MLQISITNVLTSLAGQTAFFPFYIGSGKKGSGDTPLSQLVLQKQAFLLQQLVDKLVNKLCYTLAGIKAAAGNNSKLSDISLKD